MTWTNTPPTMTGWYWFRREKYREQAPQILQVVSRGGQLLALGPWPMYVAELVGQWAGPLQPPEEHP